jgi:hypothetical protein
MKNDKVAKVANIISVIAVIAAFIPYSLGQSYKTILMTDGVCLAIGAFAQVVKGLTLQRYLSIMNYGHLLPTVRQVSAVVPPLNPVHKP